MDISPKNRTTRHLEPTEQSQRANAIELVELVEEVPHNQFVASVYDTSRARGRSSDTASVEDLAFSSVVASYFNYYASGESHTARAKRYDLNYFLDFLVERRSHDDEVRVRDWTLQATKDYIAHRLGAGESPATVSRRLATIKHLGRTLAERIPGFINPAREARGPVLQTSRPKSLSDHEIALLRDAGKSRIEQNTQSDSFIEIRNYTLLEVLLSTGLRADEVRKLRLKQLTVDYAWLRDVQTKGKKFRSVYLQESLRPIILRYLSVREETLSSVIGKKFRIRDEDLPLIPLFISLKGARPSNPLSFALAPKTLWRIISEVGLRAQALSPTPISALHPHLLRHTFAHGLLETSHDVRLVAQALGHSDVRTTMRYTERMDEEIADAIEKKRDR